VKGGGRSCIPVDRCVQLPAGPTPARRNFERRITMFGKRIPETPEMPLLFPKEQSFAVLRAGGPVLVEFTGAIATMEGDGALDYTPRDKITVNIHRISGFYDHTILVDGRKIRVMETYSQIALKILEAMR